MGTARRQTTVIVQSVFDFAIREINALEQRIVVAEDDADAMLWEQACQVVAQLGKGKLSQRQLAKQWINGRTGQPYSQSHVFRVAVLVERFFKESPRPRFRDAYNELANEETPTNKLAVHQSSVTPEHYTPPVIIAIARTMLGSIDLDPCSDPDHTVPAARHYTREDDGLAQSWTGRVYMNPPYGDGIEAWIEKLCTAHEARAVPEAIALLPARPDTQWFKRLRNYVCCFVEGRLTFIGNEDPAPFPSVLFYLGDDLAKFCAATTKLGAVWQRVR